MKWLLFVILSCLFLPLYGQSDTTMRNLWWLETAVNNSFKYSYSPPSWGSTNPNIVNWPVGVHSSSLFGGALSWGFSRQISSNFYVEYGVELLFHRRNSHCDMDSIRDYCDSTGVEVAYNVDANKVTSQVHIALCYSLNRFSFALGTNIPVFLSNSYVDTYISYTKHFTSNQWLWDYPFPSVWLNCSIGYKILPRIDIIGSYNWFTSETFRYRRDFSLGCRYNF
ncbi:MAG: hypothetical protein AB7V36_11040 [Bacteroidales bacterium]